MNTQANGIGNYTRTRMGKGRNPNGNGPSAEQMARVAAAGAESARRREAEQAAKREAEPAQQSPVVVFVYRETASGLRLLDSGSLDGMIGSYAHNHSRGQVQEVKTALSAGEALGIRWDGNVTVFSPHTLTVEGRRP